MRVFILTMNEPVFTLPFLGRVAAHMEDELVGIAVSQRNRLHPGKRGNKAAMLLKMILIMGPWHFVRSSVVSVMHRVRRGQNPLEQLALERGIPVHHIASPNDPEFLAELEQLDIDIIISQAQYVLGERLLALPKLGIINRHNALLPRNRGRLTPFWVLFRGENETGVSVHWVEKDLDSGRILVQERIAVDPSDTVNSLARKCYDVAPSAMLEALDVIRAGGKPMVNSDSLSNYNPFPSIWEALRFRFQRIFFLHLRG